jgi:hypothetical protein
MSTSIVIETRRLRAPRQNRKPHAAGQSEPAGMLIRQRHTVAGHAVMAVSRVVSIWCKR